MPQFEVVLRFKVEAEAEEYAYDQVIEMHQSPPGEPMVFEMIADPDEVRITEI